MAILLIPAQASWIRRAMIRLKLFHGTLIARCQVKKILFLCKFSIRPPEDNEYSTNVGRHPS
jgi:hypothetical protein